MKRIVMIMAASIFATVLFGQVNEEKSGKTFEEPKIDGSKFEKIKVTVGADFALQFQSLKHHADSVLIPLGGNINLPAANLNVNADLAPGIKVNLVTYLSARHHNESWVKGGYLLIDQLPFLHSELADKIMKDFTLKVGVMEINYGDNHFYRSDNGHVINNPFVGNWILDGFTTAPAAEIYFRHNGILAMGGITGGNLKPALGGYDSKNKVWMPYNMGKELQYYFKLGYDRQINDNIRIRPSVSTYLCSYTHGGTLYAGDRAGSRYFLVMNKKSLGSTNAYDITQNVTNGYFGPGSFTKDISVMGNLYLWLYGFELFGTYEIANGQNNLGIYARDYKMTHMGIQGVYYFGKEKQFDVGARYNTVTKALQEATTTPVVNAEIPEMSTNRIQVAAGWKMTPSIYTKLEYVKQDYSGFVTYGLGSSGFNGLMVEAAISF
jgi:hypothetical protein